MKSPEAIYSGKHEDLSDSPAMLTGYVRAVKVVYPEIPSSKKIVLEIWDTVEKMSKGDNAPIAVVRVDGERVETRKLIEISWAKDVWAAEHWNKRYLYIESRHRLRRAHGIYSYVVKDRKPYLFFNGVTFNKSELLQEVKHAHDEQ
ncbi:MAG: hypothetical protein AAF492_10475 [Verrucomicrobiota bacterium]